MKKCLGDPLGGCGWKKLVSVRLGNETHRHRIALVQESKDEKKLDWKRINSNCNKMGWKLKIASAVEIANAELLIEAAGRKNLITDIKTNRSTKFSRFPEQIKISEPRMKSNLTKRKKNIPSQFP